MSTPPPQPQPPLKKSKATHDDSHLKDDYLEPPPRLIEEEDLYTSPSAEDREQLLQETTTTTSSTSPSSTTQDHDGTSTLMMSVLPSFSEEEEFPLKGMSAGDAKQRVMNELNTDFKKPRFNLASYINITQHEGQDQEEIDLAILGLSVNIAETAAYPFTTSLHEKLVSMIAKLWHCPPIQSSSPPSPPSSSSNTPRARSSKYCGTSTIGSTEACLLGGLALKLRWKEWYKKYETWCVRC